jgi:hypothetical protein
MEPPNGLAFSGAASLDRKVFEPMPTFTIALISLDAQRRYNESVAASIHSLAREANYG